MGMGMMGMMVCSIGVEWCGIGAELVPHRVVGTPPIHCPPTPLRYAPLRGGDI